MIDIIEQTTNKTPMDNVIPIKGYSINSREVAQMVNKQHKDLFVDIRKYISYMEEIDERKIPPTEYFIESTYTDKQNRQKPCYEITKMGCEMIANKLTGKKGVLFTATYVKKFNEMEQMQNNNTEITPIKNEMQALKTFFNVLEHHHSEIAEIKKDIKLLKEQKPKQVIVEHTETRQETMFSKINAYSTTSIGRAFNLSAVALNAILNKEGVIRKVMIRYISKDKEGVSWIITDKYKKQGYSLQKYHGVKNIDKIEPVEITFAWTPKGVGLIVELLKRKGYQQYYEIDNRTRARSPYKKAVL